MKRLAEGEKPIVRIPVIVEPVEVHLTLAVITIEVRHVTVVTDLSHRPNV